MWKLIRPYIRNFYRIFTTFIFFTYDFIRYVKFGGWKGNMEDYELRNYNLAMIYHGLEKSLSYKNRNPNSGWKNAFQIIHLLKIANNSNKIGFHDRMAKEVLEKFINLEENKYTENAKKINNQLSILTKFIEKENTENGSFKYTKKEFYKGKLENPEDFFNSRYSLREFSNELVSHEEIEQAVNLAMKSPSVCNRQAWGIYHTSEQDIKDVVLTYQQGNKPFGKHIPNIIVITTDLKAFFAPNEHYQHWIDGGILAMSIMYSFHAMGIATCALNWSAKPKDDIGLRKELNIPDNKTIIMVLAIGYPNDINKVCVSPRRPIDEVLYKLERK